MHLRILLNKRKTGLLSLLGVRCENKAPNKELDVFNHNDLIVGRYSSYDMPLEIYTLYSFLLGGMILLDDVDKLCVWSTKLDLPGWINK